MRRIGSISSEQQAQTLRDYLFTQEIEAQVDQGADGWNVWVLDEDHLETARKELAEFQANPLAEKFVTATTQAQARRQARLDEDLKARKQQVNMRERWERPVYQRIPITILLIVASVAVTVATEFGRNRELTNHVYIQHVEFTRRNLVRYIEWDPRLTDVRSGEVWRLVTPIFLHLDWLHIVFNMYWLFLLGTMIEEAKGKWRFLSIVLVIAIASNVVQFWGPVYQLADWSQLFDHPKETFSFGPSFGGMSGVVYGLVGYLWMKSKFAPDEGFFIPKHLVVLFAVWTLLCLSGLLSGLVGPIANTAHLVGLFTGMILALTPVLYRSVKGA